MFNIILRILLCKVRDVVDGISEQPIVETHGNDNWHPFFIVHISQDDDAILWPSIRRENGDRVSNSVWYLLNHIEADFGMLIFYLNYFPSVEVDRQRFCADKLQNARSIDDFEIN